MRSRPRWIAGRTGAGIALAGGVLLGILAAFAIVLINQQQGDRQDIKDNFRDRATVSAALTQSLFEASSTAGSAENTRNFGTREVSAEVMDKAASQGQSAFMVLLGPNQEVIAASSDTPKPVIRRLLGNPPDVAAVAGGKSFSVSNLLRLPGLQTFELSTPVESDFGKRVLVTGVSPQLLAVFLSGYLKKVPNVGDGAAYLLDGNDLAIAATSPGAPPGSTPSTPGLDEALSQGGDQGSFGDGQYFVSAPVQSTPWKVVSTAPEDALFSSVTGAHKWVPWLIFALFALASAFALLLLSRVLRNAKELADANQRLEDANQALERRASELGRSNEELEQFASIASHDLKEPLRKVQTLTELLVHKEGDRLSDEGRGYLNRATAAGGRMQELIDDLLKFSRVATQGRPFEPVDLREIALQTTSDLEAVIEHSGAKVEVGELPPVMADPLQMRQLMQNLISNALKFRREDVPPVVRISGRKQGRLAELEVADNGIGFDPRYNTRIFRVFERLHGRGAYEGTGIGLALCRKIVDRHGGSITASGVPDQGAVFTVTLPLAERATPPGQAATNGDGARAESGAVHA